MARCDTGRNDHVKWDVDEKPPAGANIDVGAAVFAARRATPKLTRRAERLFSEPPIPAPLAYYTFGGWKRSSFGDLNQHGPDSVRFYTKTVTSRWPSGMKEGAEFVIPTMR